jgi:hypothetical protein
LSPLIIAPSWRGWTVASQVHVILLSVAVSPVCAFENSRPPVNATVDSPPLPVVLSPETAVTRKNCLLFAADAATTVFPISWWRAEVKTKLRVRCGFSGMAGRHVFTGAVIPGVPPSDPERAVAELRRAGYEIARHPPYVAGHPLDDCFDAIIEGPDDPKIIEAVRQEVEAIIVKYGGDLDEWGVDVQMPRA